MNYNSIVFEKGGLLWQQKERINQAKEDARMSTASEPE
jgi:hypothetical protein